MTLNDPVFVEASQGLARRVLKEGPKVLFKVLSDATKAANAICGPEVTEDAP